jgi:monoterpene epsilon-lactone hydrolase
MAIRLRPRQVATISPQAAAFLQGIPSPWIPSPLISAMTSAGMALRFRRQFQAQEDVVEERLIADRNLTVERGEVAGVPVQWITPPALAFADAVLLNIHGGGFVMGTARERTALLMASELNIRVCSVDYALAPEAKFPVALDQCLVVLDHLISEHGAANVVGTSSSSGGSQMLAMLHKAKARGIPMPAALGLFTPAADISGDGDSAIANNGRDVQRTDLALALTRHYVGEADRRDPLVSPIYGDFDNTYPPTIITTGTRDTLASNGIRLYWRLRAAGVPVELRVGEGMWHGFNWEPDLPEAVTVRRDVTDFLARHLAGR